MSTEICQICKEECTPWFHINGHVCCDCGNSNKWISVEDKLPEILETVIFYVPQKNGGFICIGYIIPPENRGTTLDGKPYFWFVEMSENEGFSEEEVTHWMPLPNPPTSHTG